MKKTELLTKLGLTDPCKGFIANPNIKLWGWNGGSELFGKLIERFDPKLIIEVGSWMGQSTINMATCLKQQDKEDSCVIAVDTWLGSREHWIEPDLRQHLKLQHGFPTFYYDFLSNVVNHGVGVKVMPIPMPSSIGSEYLYNKLGGEISELIYVDGSHEQQDVYQDLTGYWKLLKPDCIIFGDDYDWEGVNTAVHGFAAEVGTPVLQLGGPFWALRKQPKQN